MSARLSVISDVIASPVTSSLTAAATWLYCTHVFTRYSLHPLRSCSSVIIDNVFFKIPQN